MECEELASAFVGSNPVENGTQLQLRAVEMQFPRDASVGFLEFLGRVTVLPVFGASGIRVHTAYGG
jgi:hypothetical protein